MTKPAALREAARCYRCDAETGSADYAVRHREDLFSMARTHPQDTNKHQVMLKQRLLGRENPFPGRALAIVGRFGFSSGESFPFSNRPLPGGLPN